MSHAQYRPSPVKFTNQRPEQFPVKPKPERLPLAAHSHDSNHTKTADSSVPALQKHDEISENPDSQRSMLSLETLKDFTDFGKEEVMLRLADANLKYNRDLCVVTNRYD